MITTFPSRDHKEMANIVALLSEDIFTNHLIVGDIHAPTNKLSDIYTLTKNDIIIGGWSVFKGFSDPTVIFPPNLEDSWESIRRIVELLNYPKINVPFPLFDEDKKREKFPWIDWNYYSWKSQFTDIAMRLTKKDLDIMDITHLPKIRGAVYDDIPKLVEYFDEVKRTESPQGIFHPFQVESDMYVVAVEDNEIVAVGGTNFETPYTVQMGNIHVKQNKRGIGLGRAITTAVALGIIKTGRVPTLFVNENNNKAIELYKSLGFEEYNRFVLYQGLKN